MRERGTVGESFLGELEAYCYLVQRGGKPAASLALQDRLLDTAKSIVDGHGLCWYVERLSSGWSTVWVYRYPHILDVIKATPRTPRSVFDHWVLGNLFGYSEEAIRDFITTNSAS